MCTMISQQVQIAGSGKGVGGWFDVRQANVAYDHPFDVALEHALTIDFVNEAMGPGRTRGRGIDSAIGAHLGGSDQRRAGAGRSRGIRAGRRGWGDRDIYPITLGGGKRLFADGTIPAAFKVTESQSYLERRHCRELRACRRNHNRKLMNTRAVAVLTKGPPCTRTFHRITVTILDL